MASIRVRCHFWQDTQQDLVGLPIPLKLAWVNQATQFLCAPAAPQPRGHQNNPALLSLTFPIHATTAHSKGPLSFCPSRNLG